jgi:hypothetical protein
MESPIFVVSLLAYNTFRHTVGTRYDKKLAKKLAKQTFDSVRLSCISYAKVYIEEIGPKGSRIIYSQEKSGAIQTKSMKQTPWVTLESLLDHFKCSWK